MSTLVVIDGHAILHRAFHALPPLTTKDGKNINAVYGFLSMLLKLRDDFKPTHLAVTFDRPKPTFRKQLYVGYQATRPKMADELSTQIQTVHEVLSVMGVAVFEMDGYEADDVIGTLATKCRDMQAIIVTGDRDILQLVDEQTKVCMPVMGLSQVKIYGPREVKEKFGIMPAQIVDYKALVGDASDNYPGVPGIGPKTAVTFLQTYENVENLYLHLDEVKNERIRKILMENSESAALSKKLATIVRDVPIEINWQLCKIKPWDRPDILAKLDELEFRTLIPRFMTSSATRAKSLLKEKQAEKPKSIEKNTSQLDLFN